MHLEASAAGALGEAGPNWHQAAAAPGTEASGPSLLGPGALAESESASSGIFGLGRRSGPPGRLGDRARPSSSALPDHCCAPKSAPPGGARI
eukprot:9503996-Pyramimonas_sp.AAC.1